MTMGKVKAQTIRRANLRWVVAMAERVTGLWLGSKLNLEPSRCQEGRHRACYFLTRRKRGTSSSGTDLHQKLEWEFFT